MAATAALQLARALVEAKRISEALPLLSTFKAKYPGSKLLPDAQYLLGWVKYTNGDRQGGLKDLNEFATANPNHDQAPEARRLVAQGYAKYGDRTQRITAYKSLMAQNPPTAEAYAEAAALAGGLGLLVEQEAAWRKLRTDFPTDPLTRKMAGDLARTAFEKKNWKDAITLGTVAAQSNDDTVRADGWLTVGESELKQRRFAPAAKAFESVGSVSDVEAGVRFRALAGLGLAREELKEYNAALTAYEAVAKNSPDTTLRDWARARAAAVKPYATKPANGTTPKRSEPAKPGSKKS